VERDLLDVKYFTLKVEQPSPDVEHPMLVIGNVFPDVELTILQLEHGALVIGNACPDVERITLVLKAMNDIYEQKDNPLLKKADYLRKLFIYHY
jgi:hypothetical protein